MIPNTLSHGKDEPTDNNESETKPLMGMAGNVTLQDPLSLNNSSPLLNQPLFPTGYPQYKYVLSDDTGIDGTIVLMLTISFLSSISFSLALPALWPYIHSLGGELDDLGWAIALHSTGTVLLAPLLIAWIRRRSMREVLIGSLLIMAGGGVLHGMSTHIYMLLIARFIIGAGSSNHVITTIYLAQVGRRTRDRALYLNGIVTVVGFALGPSITSCFTPLDVHWKAFKLNSSTAPGYIITCLALIATLFTMCVSLRTIRKRSRRRSPHADSYDPDNNHPIYNNSATSYDIAGSLLNYGVAGSSGYFYDDSNDGIWYMLKDLWANRDKLPLAPLFVCLFIYFFIVLTFGVWETLGAYLTETELNWNVLVTGLMFAGLGVVSGITLFSLKYLTKVLAARLILPAGAFSMALGAVLLIIVHSNWSIPMFSAAIVLIAVGYTVSVVMVMHVYGCALELSAEIPPSAVGWLSACGSVARIIGPVIAAYIKMNTKDTLALMIYAAAIPAVVVVCALVSYKRLPP